MMQALELGVFNRQVQPYPVHCAQWTVDTAQIDYKILV